MALRFPCAGFLLCFVKKLTVIGIIGKTQGVNNAAKPPRNAKKNIVHKPFSSSFGFWLSMSVDSLLQNLNKLELHFGGSSGAFSYAFELKKFKLL